MPEPVAVLLQVQAPLSETRKLALMRLAAPVGDSMFFKVAFVSDKTAPELAVMRDRLLMLSAAFGP
jgi:hypothetical protein